MKSSLKREVIFDEGLECAKEYYAYFKSNVPSLRMKWIIKKKLASCYWQHRFMFFMTRKTNLFLLYFSLMYDMFHLYFYFFSKIKLIHNCILLYYITDGLSSRIQPITSHVYVYILKIWVITNAIENSDSNFLGCPPSLKELVVTIFSIPRENLNHPAIYYCWFDAVMFPVFSSCSSVAQTKMALLYRSLWKKKNGKKMHDIGVKINPSNWLCNIWTHKARKCLGLQCSGVNLWPDSFHFSFHRKKSTRKSAKSIFLNEKLFQIRE